MIAVMTDFHSEFTLILGGARSGKSTYAQLLAEEHGGRVLYVATAEAGDEEMAERIAVHQASRPKNWRTLEAPVNVGERILEVDGGIKAELVLLDCITLLTSNLIVALPENEMFSLAQTAVKREMDGLIKAYEALCIPWIVVSNEVGLDLVPAYPLGRIYRDVLGWANQYLASRASRVIFMIAGIPMKIKV